MNAKKIIYIVLGLICFGCGTVGVFLPILPTVPFYLATAFFFGRSSERLNNWFKGTRLYRENLENFVDKKGMTKATKAKILITVSLLMGFGFFMMKNVLIGRVVLAIVWVAHMIYFLLCVKTIEN